MSDIFGKPIVLQKGHQPVSADVTLDMIREACRQIYGPMPDIAALTRESDPNVKAVRKLGVKTW